MAETAPSIATLTAISLSTIQKTVKFIQETPRVDDLVKKLSATLGDLESLIKTPPVTPRDLKSPIKKLPIILGDLESLIKNFKHACDHVWPIEDDSSQFVEQPLIRCAERLRTLQTLVEGLASRGSGIQKVALRIRLDRSKEDILESIQDIKTLIDLIDQIGQIYRRLIFSNRISNIDQRLSEGIPVHQIISTQTKLQNVAENEAISSLVRRLLHAETVFEQDFISPSQSSSTATNISQVSASTGLVKARGREFQGHRSTLAQPLSKKENSNSAEFHYQIKVCENDEVRIDTIKTALQNHPQSKVLANSTDGSKRSPLHLAAQRGNIKLARILLDFSANINAKDSQLSSVLDFAVQHNNENFVAFLLDQGVDETAISNWNRDRFKEMKDMIELRKERARKTKGVSKKRNLSRRPWNVRANLFAHTPDGTSKTNSNIGVTDDDDDTESVLSTSVRQLSMKPPARVVNTESDQDVSGLRLQEIECQVDGSKDDTAGLERLFENPQNMLPRHKGSCFSSPTPSISSTESEAPSDGKYTEVEMVSVAEQFANMLAHDQSLGSLYERGMKDTKIGPERFANNHRRLLKLFGHKLGHEVQTPLEHLTAQFVRNNSRRIASLVRKQFDPSYAETMRDLLKSQPLSNEKKRDQVEELLHIRRQDIDRKKSLEIENNSEDEDDPSGLTSLEAVETFLIKSDAFIDFKKQLHGFVIPRALHIKSSGDLEQANRRSKNTIETYEASAEEMHEGLDDIRYLSTGSEKISEQVKRDSKSTYYMKWRAISSGLLLHLKRATRPRVRVGYYRAEWLCTCGQHLYRDFEKSNIFAGQYSRQRISGNTNMPPIQSPTPLNAGVGLLGSQNIATSTTHMGASNNSGNSRSQKNHQIQTIENLSQSGTKKRRFFEVCVNTGGYTITLGEIDITDVQSDQELFSKIVGKYYNLRAPRFRRMLMKPVNVHFVFFGLRKGHRVSIRDRPIVLPPKEEIEKQRYEYSCSYPPPMDRYEFLHYFYNFSNGHPDAEYFERFPKRLNLPLCNPQSQDDHGWGIHIIEGPNRVLLTWLCVSVLIVSFIVSVTYAVIMKTQEQGFGIGSWMVAVLTTSLAAVYFQFEES